MCLGARYKPSGASLYRTEPRRVHKPHTSYILAPFQLALFFSFGSVQSPRWSRSSTILSSRAIQFVLVRHRSGREYCTLYRSSPSPNRPLTDCNLICSSAHPDSTTSYIETYAPQLSVPNCRSQSRSNLSVIPLASSTFFLQTHSNITPRLHV